MQNPINDLEKTKQGNTIMMYVRTAIYIIGVVAAIVSLVVGVYGNSQLANIIAQSAAFISSAFGVAFNPINGGR